MAGRRSGPRWAVLEQHVANRKSDLKASSVRLALSPRLVVEPSRLQGPGRGDRPSANGRPVPRRARHGWSRTLLVREKSRPPSTVTVVRQYQNLGRRGRPQARAAGARPTTSVSRHVENFEKQPRRHDGTQASGLVLAPDSSSFRGTHLRLARKPFQDDRSVEDKLIQRVALSAASVDPIGIEPTASAMPWRRSTK